MLLRYFYDDRLAQASYLVGCAKTGEALVVDPARDITPYLQTAAKEGLKITHVTETHIHADFVSGSRELGAATGATIYLSDMGDENWKYQYAHEPNVVLVYEGDSWMVGNVKVDVLHTPGHTPEHLAFMITDTAGANQPMGVFTGDFLFVGDVGRPDLLEAAAGMMGTAEPGARRQFQTVERFKALPDYLQIWPAHGAGSACGKALGAIPSTTLGYEKLFNPAFQFTAEDAFVHWLLSGQPEAPRYFAQMKKVNKIGPALLKDLLTPRLLDRAALDELLAQGTFVADFRSRTDYAAANIAGTVSIPERKDFSTFVGWFIDYDKPFAFLAPSPAAVDELLTALRNIGIDQVAGYATPGVVSGKTERLPEWSTHELAKRLPQNGIVVIDVRNQSEFAEEHIRGARHIHLGALPQSLAQIPRDHTVITNCASGYRSQIAASLLRSQGFQNVINLRDGKEIWAKTLETARGA
ncbi:MAG: MBL fold metallo-hydrolase [Caldilineaceae bacterium]|nr:MBL fold metallo-hydrolase [Caldilineaceae bacterium]